MAMYKHKGLPFRLSDYLELVDWTGRIIREDKRDAIQGYLPLILKCLQIGPKHWLYMTQHFESKFKGLWGILINSNRPASCGILTNFELESM